MIETTMTIAGESRISTVILVVVDQTMSSHEQIVLQLTCCRSHVVGVPVWHQGNMF